MDSSPLVANALAAMVAVAVFWVAATITRGAWRVVIFSTGVIAMGGVWFSLPPAYDMRYWYFGGRYLLPVVVPAAVALLLGARIPANLTGRVSDTAAVSGTRSASNVALAVATVWVGAVLVMGALTTPWVRHEPIDQTGSMIASMVASIAELGPGETGTFETQGCRAAPNPAATSRGMAATARWSNSNLELNVSPPDLVAARPIGVYVIATRGTQNWLVSSDGQAVAFDPAYFSKFDPSLPSGCFWGPDPGPSTKITGTQTAVIPAAAWSSIGPGAAVTIGVGDSLNDALANGTYQSVGTVPD